MVETQDGLKALHRNFFEQAKQNLLTFGSLVPAAMFVFSSATPEAALDRAGLTTKGKPSKPATLWEPLTHCAVAPLLMTPGQMLDGLARSHEALAKGVEIASLGARMATGKRDDAWALRAMQASLGWDRGDIVAHLLRWTARQLEAFAILKVDEAWLAKAPPEGAAGVRPSQSPDRVEVLIATLETRTASAAMSVEILRLTPGDDATPAVGFGLETSDFSGLGGRFFDLIERAQ